MKNAKRENWLMTSKSCTFLSFLFIFLVSCGKKDDTQKVMPSQIDSAGQVNLRIFPTNPPPDQSRVRLNDAGQPVIRDASFDDKREAPKKLAPMDESEKKLFDDLKGVFRNAADDSVRVMALEEMIVEDFQAPEIFDVAKEAFTSTDPDVLLAALELVADFDDPRVLDVVELAIRDQDPFVRAAAVETLRFLEGPEKAELLAAALDDWSEDVHDAVFNILVDQPDDVKYGLLSTAARSSKKQVVSRAVTLALHDGVKESIDIFLSAMDSPDEEVKFDAMNSFFILTGEEFETSSAARSWWMSNQGRFTRDMELK